MTEIKKSSWYFGFPSFDTIILKEAPKPAKVFKKDGSLTAYASAVLHELARSYGSYFPLYKAGAFLRGKEKLYTACFVLAALGIRYSFGNQAPRGGEVGAGITFDYQELVSALIDRAF